MVVKPKFFLFIIAVMTFFYYYSRLNNSIKYILANKKAKIPLSAF